MPETMSIKAGSFHLACLAAVCAPAYEDVRWDHFDEYAHPECPYSELSNILYDGPKIGRRYASLIESDAGEKLTF